MGGRTQDRTISTSTRVRAWKLFLCALLTVFSAVAIAQDPQDKAQVKPDPLAAVDEITQQVSQITGLQVKRKVPSEMMSRDQIRAHLATKVKEQTTAAEMHSEQVAFTKFGLLPPGFQLEKFIVDLLTEQAAAFYDPREKKFFVADWIPLEMQKPAIAHELVHALQDQYTDLEAFMDGKGLNADEKSARQAVAEGEGVLAMMDYMLAPMGSKAADMPNLAEMVSQATQAENAQFPILTSAPPYLRESLLFPYTAGLSFVQAKTKKYGKDVYSALLKDPPRSTHEIMHPNAPAIPPTDIWVPEVPKDALKGYKKLDTNTFGEFEVFVLIKTMVSESDARVISPSWRGFRYDIYENGDRAILAHRSVWKDAEAAGAFAAAYRKVIAKKGTDNECRVDVHGDFVDVTEGVRQ